MSTPSSPAPDRAILTALVDDVSDAAREDHGNLDEMLHHASARGLLPIMTLVALLLVSPLSGIPLFSTAMGFFIGLCATQAAFGRTTLWLPRVLRNRKLDEDRAVSAMGRVRKVARWLEEKSSRRLIWLSRPPARTVFLSVAALYGFSMPIMEFIPFSSSLLGLSVVLIGLGLLLRDGLLLLLSLLPTVVAGTLVVALWQI